MKTAIVSGTGMLNLKNVQGLDYGQGTRGKAIHRISLVYATARSEPTNMELDQPTNMGICYCAAGAKILHF